MDSPSGGIGNIVEVFFVPKVPLFALEVPLGEIQEVQTMKFAVGLIAAAFRWHKRIEDAVFMFALADPRYGKAAKDSIPFGAQRVTQPGLLRA